MKINKTNIIFSIGLMLIIIGIFLNFSSAFEYPLEELGILKNPSIDRPSPSDWVPRENIIVHEDKIIIYVNNARLSRYASTKSMDPVLDDTATGMSIPIKSPESLQVGDIISFSPSPLVNYLVVHRIIEIGEDEEGWYAITKGDNV